MTKITLEVAIAQLKERYQFQSSGDAFFIMMLIHHIEQSRKHGVMQVPQFEQLLTVRLEELPYTKHLDDGQYNDGQAYGFECGARWAYETLSSGTAVADGAAGTGG